MMAIAGDDARFEYLPEMLRENGTDAIRMICPEDLKDADEVLSRYPFSAETEEALRTFAPEAKLILLPAGGIPEALRAERKVVSLLDDAAFVNENAMLTAEGAISAAMRDAPFALSGERVMVVGYGRIGRALTEMLVGLRARVFVCSRRESGRLSAMARGASAVSPEGMKAELPDSRVIFITSPDRVLARDALSYVSRRAFLYDLSSAPYGMDLESALQMGLNARREPALPGRYCPESAAKCMARAILRTQNAEEAE